jgi:hypothetical protein
VFRLVPRLDGTLRWTVTAPRDDDAEPDEDDDDQRAQQDADTLAALDPPPRSQRDVQTRLKWGGSRANAALRIYRSGSAPGALSVALPAPPPLEERSAEHSDRAHDTRSARSTDRACPHGVLYGQTVDPFTRSPVCEQCR